jgi:hypothetical protein
MNRSEHKGANRLLESEKSLLMSVKSRLAETIRGQEDKEEEDEEDEDEGDEL